MSERGLEVDLDAPLGAFDLQLAFSVAGGETLALIGPSGAGKSSVLEIVAGLRQPRLGRVACGDAVWLDTARRVDLAPDERRVGLVFQDYALFPHMGVRANVAYGLRARGRSRGEADALAGRWLDRLGLGAHALRPVSALSGGERQRVALARALAAEPDVLLLDEPFAALDVATRAAVRGELRAFLRSVPLPSVVVTHDPVDALALGDRIAVLEAGRLVQVGPREELMTHPRTALVGQIAGLNLFRVDVASGTGLKEARGEGLVFHVLADGRSGPAFVAFAPDEVNVSRESPRGSAQNVFGGTVLEVLHLADRLRVVMDAGAPLAADLTREAAAALQVTPGCRLWLSVKAAAIRVYG